MKIYIVQNNDGIIMAVSLRKRSAELVAEKIGQLRWHEAWTVTYMETDTVDPSMLGGSDSYRKMQRTLKERAERAKS